MTDYPEHPGNLIARKIVERYGVELDEAADLLEVAPIQLHSFFIGEQPVSPEFALKLAAVFDFNPDTLVRLQAEYDLWWARHEPDVAWRVARLARIGPPKDVG